MRSDLCKEPDCEAAVRGCLRRPGRGVKPLNLNQDKVQYRALHTEILTLPAGLHPWLWISAPASRKSRSLTHRDLATKPSQYESRLPSISDVPPAFQSLVTVGPVGASNFGYDAPFTASTFTTPPSIRQASQRRRKRLWLRLRQWVVARRRRCLQTLRRRSKS